MPIVCEVPTHLTVKDTLVFGLAAHQLVRLAAAGSLAYLIWDQATVLPPEARIVLAGLLIAAGLACALVQPGGRPLDRWVLVACLYLLSPRRLAWRSCRPKGTAPRRENVAFRRPVGGGGVRGSVEGWPRPRRRTLTQEDR